MDALGSLESTQEARVALGCHLEQLLRFFRAFQIRTLSVNQYSSLVRSFVFGGGGSEGSGGGTRLGSRRGKGGGWMTVVPRSKVSSNQKSACSARSSW